MKPAILYDSYCKICNAEVRYYMRKDKNKNFDYLDIMHPNFDAQTFNLTKKDVHKYFHVIDSHGEIHRGVDGFYLIWKKLDRLHSLQAIYRTRWGRAVMEMGYKGFVILRPYLPRRPYCEDGYCEV